MNDYKTKIKLFIKNTIQKLGYQIVRIPYQGTGSDELIKVKIGDHSIWLNGNHQLPQYMRNSYYNTNLPRLAVKAKEKYEELIMIDVGANVGDTVAFVRSKSYFPIVCIEGDDDFFQLLKKNIENFNDVSAFQFLLSEKANTVSAALEKNEGSSETARIKNSILPGYKKINFITLDNFLETNANFKKAKLLKIDTDGYDLKIIRGGFEFIRRSKPILFFEYDTVFLAEQKEDGLATLGLLEEFGYKDAVFYDNQGKFILSTCLSDHLMLKQLHNFIDRKYRTPFPFYDIALFHEEDGDIAKKFIEDEMRLFYNE